MKEQSQICKNIIEIIKNKNMQDYKDDAIWELIQYIFTGDVFSGISSIKNIKDMIFHAPTIIFWNKMQKFLLSTYRNFEEQVKMSSKFSKDNKKYQDFVLQMMETVDKLDDEIKVDYYSNITRSFFLELIDEDLFYKFRQILMSCNISELKYIDSKNKNSRFDYDIMTFSLKNYGLVDLKSDHDSNYYQLTQLALKLKEHSLNSDDNVKQKTTISEIEAPDDLVPMTDAEVEDMLK